MGLLLMTDAEAHLARLDGPAAGNWVAIGQTLTALEQQSRADASGRPWQDVVLDRLEQSGHPVSPGHLYKIRRAFAFLSELAPEAVNQTPPPKISAVEIAERLKRLDADAGKQALQDALGPNPTPYISLKKRYDEALKAQPEMKSARHVAWEKRKPTGSESIRHDQAKRTTHGTVTPAGSDRDVPQLPNGLQREASDLVQKTWLSAWNKAQEKYSEMVKELKDKVASLEEELELAHEEDRLNKEENKNLAREIRDLRGDNEDFDY